MKRIGVMNYDEGLRMYGDRDHVKERTEHCIAYVGGTKHQCCFDKGHGPRGLFCERHAKLIARRRL